MLWKSIAHKAVGPRKNGPIKSKLSHWPSLAWGIIIASNVIKDSPPHKTRQNKKHYTRAKAGLSACGDGANSGGYLSNRAHDKIQIKPREGDTFSNEASWILLLRKGICGYQASCMKNLHLCDQFSMGQSKVLNFLKNWVKQRKCLGNFHSFVSHSSVLSKMIVYSIKAKLSLMVNSV